MSFAPILTPFNVEQKKAIVKIGDTGIKQIDRDFSTGWPHFKGGSVKLLLMHNGRHGRRVKKDTRIAANMFDIPSSEQDALDSMALVHDLVQLKARGVMERESGEWFAEQVRKSKRLPDELAEIGGPIIEGTEPVLTADNFLIEQMCNRISYPSKSVELMAKCLGCGDLGELNSASGALQGHFLAQELGIPWDKIIKFQKKEIELRESFHLPLRKAENLLWKRKKQVMAHCYHVLHELEAGNITSYGQLIEKDVDFMHKWS